MALSIKETLSAKSDLPCIQYHMHAPRRKMYSINTIACANGDRGPRQWTGARRTPNIWDHCSEAVQPFDVSRREQQVHAGMYYTRNECHGSISPYGRELRRTHGLQPLKSDASIDVTRHKNSIGFKLQRPMRSSSSRLHLHYVSMLNTFLCLHDRSYLLLQFFINLVIFFVLFSYVSLLIVNSDRLYKFTVIVLNVRSSI